MLNGDLPGWVAPGSAATWDAAARTLAVSGATTIVADPAADAPWVTVASSAALTIEPATDLAVRFAGLSVSGGGSVTLSAAGPRRVLSLDDGANFTIDSTATLDLTDNAMVIGNADQSAAFAKHAAVKAQIRAAFNNFAWDQPGITSSTSAGPSATTTTTA